MASAVDWAIAQRVAVRVAGREPFSQSYHYDSLEPDFAELTVQAEALVAAETGLVSLAGPARARVTDRAGWIEANVASFQRLLRPIIDKLTSRLEANPLSPMAQKLAGAEVGMVLGWMSTRVLGQYDLLIIEDESPARPGPRLLRRAQRARRSRSSSPSHRASSGCGWRCTRSPTAPSSPGIEWMRPHFLGLVTQTLDAVDPDPKRFVEVLGRLAEARPQRREPAGRRRAHGAGGVGRAARGARPGERAHEPARGPRRHHHGPGRRRTGPERRPLLAGAAPAARVDPGDGPPAAAADRPRGQDEPVRAGRALHRRGREGRWHRSC